MSVEALSVVLNHTPEVRGTEKLVLIGIANHANEGMAWAAVPRLASYAGVTDRNVQKALLRLHVAGYITRHQQEGGYPGTHHSHRPNLYELHVSCPSGCPGGQKHSLGDPWHESARQSDPVSEATPGVGGDTPPVSPATPPPVSPATPKPEEEPSNSQTSSSQLSSPVRDDVDEREEEDEPGDDDLARSLRDELRTRAPEVPWRGVNGRHAPQLAAHVRRWGVPLLVDVALAGERPKVAAGWLSRWSDEDGMRAAQLVAARSAIAARPPRCDCGGPLLATGVCPQCPDEDDVDLGPDEVAWLSKRRGSSA